MIFSCQPNKDFCPSKSLKTIRFFDLYEFFNTQKTFHSATDRIYPKTLYAKRTAEMAHCTLKNIVLHTKNFIFQLKNGENGSQKSETKFSFYIECGEKNDVQM